MSSIPTWPELRTAFPPLGPPERDVSDGLNALLCVTHAPLEAPYRFVAPYASFNDSKRELFSGMLSFVDEVITST